MKNTTVKRILSIALAASMALSPALHIYATETPEAAPPEVYQEVVAEEAAEPQIEPVQTAEEPAVVSDVPAAPAAPAETAPAPAPAETAPAPAEVPAQTPAEVPAVTPAETPAVNTADVNSGSAVSPAAPAADPTVTPVETPAVVEAQEGQNEAPAADQGQATNEAGETDKAPNTRTEYTYEDSTIKVTARLSDPEALSDEAQLYAVPIIPSTPGYNYNVYFEALNEGTDFTYDETNTYLYDFAFWLNGVEVQPAGPVSVEVEFRYPLLTDYIHAQNNADVSIIHLPLIGAAATAYANTQAATTILKTDVGRVAIAPSQMSIDIAAQKATFQTNAFSVYAFVNTAVEEEAEQGNEEETAEETNTEEAAAEDGEFDAVTEDTINIEETASDEADAENTEAVSESTEEAAVEETAEETGEEDTEEAVNEEADILDTVIFTAVNENGVVIDGYAGISCPEFDDVLVLNDMSQAPVEIEGYEYIDAVIGDVLIDQITKVPQIVEVQEEIAQEAAENNDGLEETSEELTQNNTAYKYYYVVDGESFELMPETEITLRYKTKSEKCEYHYEDGSISVTATLEYADAVPDDAQFVVTPIFSGTQYDAYMEALNNTVDGNRYTGGNTLLYDIAFLVEGTDENGNPTGELVEYEPAAGSVNMNVSFLANQISEEIGAEKAADVNVHHLPLAEEVSEAAPTTLDATDISASDVAVDTIASDVSLTGGTDDVEFVTDSFSAFAFTVDFTYEETFSYPGEDTYTLEDVMKDLGIAITDSISSAKLELKEGEQTEGALALQQNEDGKYVLVNEVPFKETYLLTVVANGAEYLITVTDAMSSYPVNIEFYDMEMQNRVTPGTSEGAASISGNYYVRAYLRDDTGKTVGWAIQPVNLNQSAPTATFTQFKGCSITTTTNDDGTTSTSYEDLESTFNGVPDGYTVSARVVNGNNPNGISEADVMDDSTPEGYAFVSNQPNADGTATTVKMRIAYPSEYYVQVKTTDGSAFNIPEGYNMYAWVTVTHTNGKTGALVKVNPSDSTDGGKTYTVKVPAFYNQGWTSNNVNPRMITGHEQNVSVKLYVTQRTISDLRPHESYLNYGNELYGAGVDEGTSINEYIVVQNPDIPKNYNPATAGEMPMRVAVDDDTAEITSVYDIVYLGKNTDTFPDYSLEYILQSYNIVTLCDNDASKTHSYNGVTWTNGDFYSSNHTIGGILVRGDFIVGPGSEAVADSYVLDKPSAVGGLAGNRGTSPTFHQRGNPNNNHFNVYLSSENTAIGQTVNGVTPGNEGYNKLGNVIISDTFMDWALLESTMEYYSSSLLEIGDATTAPTPYYDGDGVLTIDVPVGEKVRWDFPNDTQVRINIVGDANTDWANAPGTVVSNGGTGSFYTPALKLNGVLQSETTEDGSGMSIIYNFPNASNLTMMATPEFGHVLAPEADLIIPGGNYSGCMVVNSAYANGEGHLYAYKGGKLISTEVGLTVTKKIDGEAPASTEKYNFRLDAYNKTTGQWNEVETKQNEGSEIKFSELSFKAAGTYYHRVIEVPDSASKVFFDDSQYIIKTVVEAHQEGTDIVLTETHTYYKVPAGTDPLTLNNGQIVEHLGNPIDAESAADAVVFHNTNVKAELKVTKDFPQWDQLATQEFTFTLTADSGVLADGTNVAQANVPMPDEGGATAKATRTTPTAVFGEIAYTKCGTYTYYIEETLEVVDGVTFNVDGIKPIKAIVTVTKDEDGIPSAVVTYATAAADEDYSTPSETVPTMKNAYAAAKTSLEATKSFNDWGKAESFTFRLEAEENNAGVSTPMPVAASGGSHLDMQATESAPLVNFGDITYTKPGVYNYTITEADGGVAGVTYDTTPHNVVVTVVNQTTYYDADGRETTAANAVKVENKLVPTVKYDGENSLIITNTYTAAGKVTVKATKVWEDGNNKDGLRQDVVLTLSGKYTDGEGQEQTLTAAQVAAVQDDKTFTDADFTITLDKGATGAGLTAIWADMPEKIDDQYEVTYTVSEAAIPGYTSTISEPVYDEENKTWTFTCTNAEDTNMLKLYKKFVFNGDHIELTDEQKAKLKFTITTVINGTTYYVDYATDITDTALNPHSKLAKLVTTEHKFTYADFADGMLVMEGLPTGTYTVTESGAATLINGYSWSGTVKLERTGTDSTAVKEGDVTLGDIELKGDDKATFVQVFFTNTYTQDVGALKVNKTVTIDRTALSADSPDVFKNKKFFVAVYTQDANGKTYYATNGKPVDDKNTSVSNKNIWVEIQGDLGERGGQLWINLPVGQYYVEEYTALAGVDGFDLTEPEAVGPIEVTTEKTAEKPAAAGLTNAYTKQKGSLIIDKKVFVDGVDKTSSYGSKTFYVKVAGRIDGTTYYVTSNNGILSKTESKGTVFEIKPGETLTITDLPVGEYTVTEVADEDGTAISADTAPDADMGAMTYLFTLSRTEDNATVVKGTQAAEASVVNAYTTGRFCVAVTKQWLVDGKADNSDAPELTVKLQRKLSTETETAYVDVEGQTNIKLNKDNNWSYVAIGMEQMDANGVRYDYRWVETAPEGWAEGEQEVIQKVNVPEDATDEDAEAVLVVLTKLTNSKATAQPEVIKAVTGDTSASTYNANEAFTFKLEAVSGKLVDGTDVDKADVPMPADADGKTVSIKAGETGKFGEIAYAEAGTYQYTITETAGSTPGMTYSETPVKVTVTVSADEKTGVLSATVTYDPAGKTVTNTYYVVTVKPEVTKEVTGDTESSFYNADEEFTFTLAAVTEGAPMPAADTVKTAKAGAKAVFGEITYTAEGVYKYTITETVGDTVGMTYSDTSINVTVNVAKDDSGDLKATVTYDPENDTITNTYAPASLKVIKTVDGLPDEKAASMIYLVSVKDDKGNYYALNGEVTGTTAHWVEIKKGETGIEWQNMPEGTYTVTEKKELAGAKGYTLASTTYKVGTADDAVPSKEPAEVTLANGSKKTVTVTNTYTQDTTEATVKKVWDTADETAIPGSLTVKLMAGTAVAKDADGIEIANQNLTPNEDETKAWTATVTNLPKYDASGNEIVYTWAEVDLPEGWSLTNTSTEGTVTTLTNTYAPDKTSVEVIKLWEDNHNQDGKRPDKAYVTLTATWEGDSEPISNLGTLLNRNDTVVELNAGNNWSHIWAALPKKLINPETEKNQGLIYFVLEVKNANGNPLTEYVEEYSAYGPIRIPAITFSTGAKYTVSTVERQSNTFTVTNTYQPETVDVPFTKIWDDENNKDGVRPAKVTVILYADGKPVAQKELTAADADTENADVWKGTFEKLPKYADGEEITYTVKEFMDVKLNLYYEQERDPVKNKDGVWEITNKHTPETTFTEVKKVWDDKENEAGKRPASITVTLLADGEPFMLPVAEGETPKPFTYDLTEQNGWTGILTQLPKYKNVDGKLVEIKYSWAEDEKDLPAGYALTNTSVDDKVIAEVKGTTTTLTNTYGVPTFEKKTKDVNDSTGETTGWQDTADYDLGDKVPFLLKATLPGNVSASKLYSIQFSDTLSEGLDFNHDVVAKVNGKVFSGVVVQDTDDGFTVTLTWDNGENVIGDTSLDNAEVTVEYTATLNDRAVMGSAGNTNEASLSFKSSPYQEEYQELPDKDTVIIFTYGLTFNKQNEAGEALEGAEFKLEKIVKGEKKEIALSADGSTFKAEHLDDGIYILTETEAPKGYKLMDPIQFTVSAEHVVEWDGVSPALTSLTGDEMTGKITLTADKDAGTLTGNVKNEALIPLTVVKKIEGLEDTAAGKMIYLVSVKDADGNYYALNGEVTGKTEHWVEITNAAEGITWENLSSGTYTVTEKVEFADVRGYTLTTTYQVGNGEAAETPAEVELKEGEEPTVTITNKYEPEITEATVIKVWDHKDNTEDNYPKALMVTLLADGKPAKHEDGTDVDAVRLNEENSWTATVKNLPKYADGKEITYAWSEDLENFAPSYSLTDSSVNGTVTTLTNTYTPDNTSVEVTKIWDDNNNAEGMRPTKAYVKLCASWFYIGKTIDVAAVLGRTDTVVELNADNDWSHIWTDLPKEYLNPETNKTERLVYYVKEVQNAEGDPIEEFTDDSFPLPVITFENGAKYVVDVSASQINKLTVTNTYQPETVDVPFTKIWDDENNKEGVRPAKVTVILYADGKPVAQKELTAEQAEKENANAWSGTFEKLPKYADGEEITYTVKEFMDVKLNLYYEQVGEPEPNDDGVWEITNKHTPGLTFAEVKKVWDDDNNKNGTRPESITVALFADGRQVMRPAVEGQEAEPFTYELNEHNLWSCSVESLPKYRNEDGSLVEIKYSWAEVDSEQPAGYALTDTSVADKEVDGVKGTITTLTNTYGVPTFEKKTKDVNDSTGEATGWQDTADYDFGDKVPFLLKAKLPGNVSASKLYSIQFSDTLSEGLTFNNDAVVKVNGTVVEGADVVPTNDGFTVTLTWDNGENVIGDTSLDNAEVTVEYTATLNDKADTGRPGNTNEVTLSFKNSPDQEEYQKLPEKDTVIIFTYVLRIRKIDELRNELNGAEFKLEKIVAGEPFLIERFSANSENTFAASHLDDGIYILTETNAPKGYKRMDPVRFTITADHMVVWDSPEDGEALKGLEVSVTGDVVNGKLDLAGGFIDDGMIFGSAVNEAVTHVEVTKVWDDNDNNDGKRPISILVHLWGNNEVVAEAEITIANKDREDPNKWHYVFQNLPVYDKDHNPITYTIDESRIDGYSADIPATLTGDAINGYKVTITNKHEDEVTESTVVKVWNDNDDAAGKRKDAKVTVTLLANNEPTKYSYELPYTGTDENVTYTEEGNNWTLTVGKLPKYVNGDLQTYSWIETLEDGSSYAMTNIGTVVDEDGKATTTITNTYNTDRYCLEVLKVWDDDNNSAGFRPEELKVTLKKLVDGEPIEFGENELLDAEGKPMQTEYTLNKKNHWTAMATGLPKGEFEYVWVEDESGLVITEGEGADAKTVAEYNATTDVNGTITTLTNSYKPEKVKIDITKKWDDAKNQDGVRPDHVDVKLMADGEFLQTVRLEKDGFNATVEDLPKYAKAEGADKPHEVKYTWEEYPVKGYELDDTSDEAKAEQDENGNWTVVLVNKHEPEKTEATVKKVWDDKEEKGTLPDSLTVTLYADGEETDKTVTLNEDNEWTDTIEGLAKYAKAEGADKPHEVEYTWKEGTLPAGFILTDTSVDGEITTLTNTYNVPEFEKKTKDVNDSTGDVSGWQDSADYDIGDDVPFLVTAKLPESVSVYTKYSLQFSDKMSRGLEFNKDITVKVNGAPFAGTIEEKEFADGFILKLTWDGNGEKLDASLAGAEVTVEYSGKLNGSAAMGSAGNTNEVTLSYTDNPDNTDHFEKLPDKDIVVIFTYGLTFDKVDEATGDKLTDAEFRLEKIVKGEKKPIDLTVSGSTFTAERLDDGIYILTETKAPDGYKLMKPIQFVITAEHEVVWNGSDVALTKLTGAADGKTLEFDADAGTGKLTTEAKNEAVTKIEVEKVWKDNNNNDGVRPAKITVVLKAGAEEVDSAVLTIANEKDANTWSYAFEDLPVYDENGAEIEYSINELTVDGYATEIGNLTGDAKDGYKVTITNTHEDELTKAVVKKIWDDDKNAAGYRPTTVTMKLLANNEETGIKVVLPEGNDTIPNIYEGVEIAKDTVAMTATVKKLPQYVNGVYQTYSWIEDTEEQTYKKSGYSMSDIETIKAEDGSITTTITNSYTPDRFCLAVLKVWDDGDNQDGLRPQKIDVTLYANGEVAKQDDKDVVVTLNDANNWTALVTGLPVKANGEAIEYKWKETVLPDGYTLVGADADGFVLADLESRITTLTNTHTPEFISIPITKVWNDADDQDGIRPSQVEVLLLADGKPVQKAVVKDTTLDANHNWIYTFSNLPKFNGTNTPIVYTIEEINVPAGYTAVVSGDAAHGYTVTNTHTPNTVEIEITKVWKDADNQDGIRPTAKAFAASVHLKANGKETEAYDANKSVTDNGDNTYTVKWTNLPEKQNKANINYSVKEDPITTGYTADTAEVENGGVIRNTHTPEKTKTTVKKVWVDNNDQAGIRPDHIDLKLKADGDVIKTVRIDQAGNWTYTETGLPKYKNVNGKGVEIQYTWEEYDLPAGKYVSATSVGEDGTTTITNTLNTADLTISKALVSEVTADATRDYTFTIQLSEPVSGTFGDVIFRNGKATVTIKGAGSTTIEKLPAGVTYEIAEANVVNLTPDAAVKTGTLDTSKTVDFTNTRETGSLTIKKTVVSTNAADKDKGFHFVVTLTGVSEGEKTYSGVKFKNGVSEEITLKHNESKTIEGLPAGVAYSVVESEANTDNFVTTSVGETGTIGATGTSTAAFTNTKSEGGLVVSKKVVSAITADHSKTFDIKVTLSDKTISGTYGDADFEKGIATLSGVKDGDVKIITGLPIGVKYEVTEELTGEDSGIYTVTYSGETVAADKVSGTIAADKTKVALVTNTRKTTELTISKKVESEIAADHSEAFLFTLTLTPAITGEYSGVYIENGVARLWLKAGDSITLKGIPYDTKYEVTEEKDERFTTEVTEGKATDTLASDPAAVEFTNTRNTGELVISKEVVSDVAADHDATYTFTIQLSEPINGKFAYKPKETPELVLKAKAPTEDETGVTFTNGQATITLKDGETKIIEGLPAGATYTVVEARVDYMTTTVNGDTDITNEASGTIVMDEDNPATAAFTNTRKTTDLSVTKNLISTNPEDKDMEFTFHITLTHVDGETTTPVSNGTYKVSSTNSKEADKVTFNENGEAQITLIGGETKTITGLPVGVSYTIEEDVPEGFVLTSKYGNEDTLCNVPSKAEFTNTRKEGVADLSVTKVFNYWKNALAGFDFVLTAGENDVKVAVPEPEVKAETTDEAGTTIATPMPEGADTTTKTVKATKEAKTAEFGTITFYEPGTYNYTIREIIPEDAVNEKGEKYSEATNKEAAFTKDGITYDGKTHKVQIVVKENEDRTKTDLDVKVTYDEKTANTLLVTNSYSAKGEAELSAVKTLEGRELENAEFSFVLKKITKIEGEADKEEVIETAKNDAEGKVTFKKLAYQIEGTKDETGKYLYTISEVIPDDAVATIGGKEVLYKEADDAAKKTAEFKKNGITYDPSIKEVTVNVTDYGKGKLEITYGEEEAQTFDPEKYAAFANTYEAKGTIPLHATKHFAEGNMDEQTYKFEIVKAIERVNEETGVSGFVTLNPVEVVAEGQTGTKDAESSEVAFQYLDKDGKFSLDEMAFTQDDLKEETNGKVTYVKEKFFHYIVREVIPDDAVAVIDGNAVTYKDANPAQKTSAKFVYKNVVYDNSRKVIHVKVSDDRTGKLKVQTVYRDGEPAESVVAKFTNKWDKAKIQLTKYISEYVAGEHKNAVFNFTVSGTGTWTDGTPFTFINRSVHYNADSKAAETIEIEVPYDIKGLMVEETYSGNYKPDVKKKAVTYQGVVNGIPTYAVSFTNTLTGHDHNKGIINQYGKPENQIPAIGDNGIQIVERIGKQD